MVLTLVLVAIAHLPGFAQQPSPPGNTVDGFPVVLGDKTLFLVRNGIPGVVSAEERAQVISQRLHQVASDSTIPLAAFQVKREANQSVVKVGDTLLVTVQEADAEALGKPHLEIANQILQTMKTSTSDYREERSLQKLVQGLVFAALSTIALLIFLSVLQRVVSWLLTRIRADRQDDTLNWHFQNLQLLSSNATSYLLGGFVRLTRFGLILLALSIYLPFLLSQFPVTREFGNGLLANVTTQFQTIVYGVVKYVPNLITIAIIAFLTNYVIEFAKLVIAELGREDVYFWFYPEWVRPTERLISFGIMAIAVVIAAPYLPGFGSPAFQGVSLFLGALFTLGSSSAISNAIAGIILIYTRAFRIGDIIRISDVTGQVLEKSLFVTRVASFKQEIIVIPNAAVLSGNVTNFSLIQRETGGHLALYTTVTLGYDIPWQTIHEVLIKAALATTHILAEPTPFVLQKGLNDFNVSYEINAFTDRPDIMPPIYSELHQNIQNYCNAAGIEIMSPNYLALRDGNHSTMPADYLPTDYTSSAFQVRNANGDRFDS